MTNIKLTDKNGNNWTEGGGTKITEGKSTYTVTDRNGAVQAELSKDSVTKTSTSSSSDDLLIMLAAAAIGIPST